MSKLGIGLGTETTALVLAFAFAQLDLRDIDLRVLEFNARAIRYYQACGFVVRDREVHALELDGRRYEDLVMVASPPSWQISQRDVETTTVGGADGTALEPNHPRLLNDNAVSRRLRAACPRPLLGTAWPRSRRSPGERPHGRPPR
jgi:hypothetical protein